MIAAKQVQWVWRPKRQVAKETGQSTAAAENLEVVPMTVEKEASGAVRLHGELLCRTLSLPLAACSYMSTSGTNHLFRCVGRVVIAPIAQR